MSKYDEERKKLGIPTLSKSTDIKNTTQSKKSKYDQERVNYGIAPLDSSFKNKPRLQSEENNYITPTESKISDNVNQPSYAASFLANHPTIMKGLDFAIHNPVTDAISGFGAGTERELGISYLRRMFQPDIEKGMEETRKNNPISSTIGRVVGGILPFSKASKIAGKLPFMKNFSNDIIGRIAKLGVQEGLAGLGYGAVSGAVDEATRPIELSDLVTGNDKRDILGKSLETGLEYGIGGMALGGGFKGVSELGGKLLSPVLNNIRNQNALNNINRSYNNLSQNGIAGYNNNAANSPTRLPFFNGNIKSPSSNNNQSTSQTNAYGLNDTKDRIVSSQSKSDKSILQKASDSWDKMYTEWVDNQNSLTKFSKDAKDMSVRNKAMNSKKVNSTVNYIFNDNLVDSNGNVIGESLKNIAKDIPKEKELDFWNYMLHKHNVARMNQDKPIFRDYSSLRSDAGAKEIEVANPEFKMLSDRVYKFLNDFGDSWMKETGLTSEDLLKELRKKYPSYVPTQREFSELEKGMVSGVKDGFVSQSNGIKKATGSDKNVINPLENIMNLVNRTVKNARRNQVGQQIAIEISKNPQELSKYGEILPKDYAGRLDLNNIVTVRFKGEPVHLKINDKNFLDAINGVGEHSEGGGLENVNKIFKGLITQYNPVFAARNIFRDIPTSYIYGTEKNPFKFAKDLYAAGKSIKNKSQTYEQYKALGGGESNFFSPDKVSEMKLDLMNNDVGMKKNILNKISAFNNFTETLPRFAEYQRTLNKGGSIGEALYNSGETTVNFSRGGEKAKNLDRKYVPYLNASIQGLDRFARGVKNNPLGFIAKGATAITLPTIAQEAWNQKVDPEGYANLDNRTKDAYFVIAEGNGKFIKIPKSRELGVLFSSLLQRVNRQVKGDENAYKGFFKGNSGHWIADIASGTMGTNFSPTNPIENNILSPLTLNLLSNKDFANRDIVPQYMKDRSPSLQYDEKTSEIAKKFGELANLSPKQVDYIIKSYSGVIGQIGLPLFTKGGNSMNPIKSQFESDSAYSNQPISDFYDNVNKITSQAADKNVLNNIPSDIVTQEEKLKGLFNKQAERMKVIRKIAQNGTEEQKRLANIEIMKISKMMNGAFKK